MCRVTQRRVTHGCTRMCSHACCKLWQSTSPIVRYLSNPCYLCIPTACPSTSVCTAGSSAVCARAASTGVARAAGMAAPACPDENLMLALTYQGKEAIELSRVPVPVLSDAEDTAVIVRVSLCGICGRCGARISHSLYVFQQDITVQRRYAASAAGHSYPQGTGHHKVQTANTHCASPPHAVTSTLTTAVRRVCCLVL